MSEETKQPDTPVEEAKPSSGKSGMIKYLLIGVGALVLVAGATFGTLAFLGGGDKAATAASAEAGVSTDQPAESKPSDHKQTAESAPELAAGEELPSDIADNLEADSGALDNVMKALEFLDYKPDDQELAEADSSTDVADSLEKVNWFKQMQDSLSRWEAALKSREKKLAQREQKIGKQILKIEQAESNRISKLAKLYDGMEPRAVAKLAANLDDKTVTSILPRMKPKNASAVLSLIPPKRAARLSRMMITIAEN